MNRDGLFQFLEPVGDDANLRCKGLRRSCVVAQRDRANQLAIWRYIVTTLRRPVHDDDSPSQKLHRWSEREYGMCRNTDRHHPGRIIEHEFTPIIGPSRMNAVA